MKISKPPKAQENAGDQVEIGLSFAPEWLRKWGEFFVPITGQIPDYFRNSIENFFYVYGKVGVLFSVTGRDV